MVKTAPNEYKPTFADLVFLPKTNVFVKITTEKHVYTLEHVFLIHALYRKQTLVTEQVFPLLLKELTNPCLQLVDVEFTSEFSA